MKLVRFGEKGNEKAGVVDDQGQIRDVSSIITDWNGDTLDDESISKIDSMPIANYPFDTHWVHRRQFYLSHATLRDSGF